MNAPLMTLKDIHLGIGSEDLFRDASLSIFDGDALCLVGRNGAGKSTFLKVINGEIEPDGGERVLRGGLEISTLPQNPDFSPYATLYDYARHGFDVENEYKVEGAFDAMKISRNLSTQAASGGEKRRAALARFLAVDADLWLLDEPTNHLDISAIEWLETMIRGFRGAFILISHDRRFLANLTKGTIWLDRGTVRRREIGYSGFEDWRDDFYTKEIAQWRKEDSFIEDEARWAIEGISARRKRNQGRLRRLDSMRGDQDARIKHARTPELHLGDSERSGKLIVDLKNVSKSYDKPILKSFSLKITRGESVAIVGPNGAGKSTLIRMILGLEEADSGSIRQGLNLNVAYFDQARAKFDDKKTLWEALTEDPELQVSGRSDQVMVRGQPRHVVAYLKAFLFTAGQAKSPIGTLSGGERARLLLAKIMAEESNVLVLDEPTNDLDVETLDLLQEVLLDYSGTIILVSHDRDFVDRIAKRTILMDGLGHCEVYAGGWSDLVSQRGTTGFLPADYQKSVKKRKIREQDARQKADEIAKKLSFKDAHRLEILPGEIDRTEKEIEKLETLLSDSTLYETAPIKFEKASQLLAERKDQLVLFENEWLELEEKRIELEGE